MTNVNYNERIRKIFYSPNILSFFYLETFNLVHYFKFAPFKIWLALPFVKNFLTFDNLLDSQKIAPANSYFKSNMRIQCLKNISYQY